MSSNARVIFSLRVSEGRLEKAASSFFFPFGEGKGREFKVRKFWRRSLLVSYGLDISMFVFSSLLDFFPYSSCLPRFSLVLPAKVGIQEEPKGLNGTGKIYMLLEILGTRPRMTKVYGQKGSLTRAGKR